jgi:hypothetical protein
MVQGNSVAESVFIYLGAVGSLHVVRDIADTLNGQSAASFVSCVSARPTSVRIADTDR